MLRKSTLSCITERGSLGVKVNPSSSCNCKGIRACYTGTSKEAHPSPKCPSSSELTEPMLWIESQTSKSRSQAERGQFRYARRPASKPLRLVARNPQSYASTTPLAALSRDSGRLKRAAKAAGGAIGRRGGRRHAPCGGRPECRRGPWT